MKDPQKLKLRLEHLPDTPYWRDYPYIFISYNHEDSETVYPFIDRIRALGNPAWYDGDIEFGEQWHAMIRETIKSCSLFICFLSKRFESAWFCKKEVEWAVQTGVPIIPVYLERLRFDGKSTLGQQIGGQQAILQYECGEDLDLFVELVRRNGTYKAYAEELAKAMTGKESVALRVALAGMKDLPTYKLKLLANDPCDEVRERYNHRDDVYHGEYFTEIEE